LAERSLRINEKSLGADHPTVADNLARLGSVHADRGDLRAADECFERALSIQEESFGIDSPRFATTREEFAAMLEQSGRTAMADSLRSLSP